jgi:hypothetical protein
MSLSSTISLDVAPFMAAMQQVQNVVSNPATISAPMNSQMSNVKKTMVGAAAVIGLAVKEMYSTFSDVSNLQKLGRTSGIAVGELHKLQLAFKAVGMDSGSVVDVVKTMQSAISNAGNGTGPAKEAFDQLGLSVENIQGLNPTEQFRAIAGALSNIKDPVAQASAGMKIFGQDVVGVIDAFSSGGQLDQIGKSFSTQAEMIQANAGVFSAIQRIFSNGLSILQTAKAQIRSFFTGVASEVLPALMPAINAFDAFSKASKGFDLASVGAEVGNVIAVALQAIQGGKIGELLSLSLKAGFAEAVQFINEILASDTVQALFSTAKTFGDQMIASLQKAWAFLVGLFSSPATTEGIGSTLMAGLKTVISGFKIGLFEVFREAVSFFQELPLLGEKVKEGLNSISAKLTSDFKSAASSLGSGLSGNASQLGSNLQTVISTALDTAKQVGSALTTPDPEAKANLSILLDDLKSQVKSVQDAARAANPAAAGGVRGAAIPTAAEGGRGQSFEAITSSMARIGGGGLTAGVAFTVTPMVDQQKTTNKILQQILEKPTTGEVVAKLG